MNRIWIKNSNPKYGFWETEVSSVEACKLETDFLETECFVPEARFKELEQKLAEAIRDRDGYEQDFIKYMTSNRVEVQAHSETRKKLAEALVFIKIVSQFTDHDAEALGYHDGEAPTESSKLIGRAREFLAKLEEGKE